MLNTIFCYPHLTCHVLQHTFLIDFDFSICRSIWINSPPPHTSQHWSGGSSGVVLEEEISKQQVQSANDTGWQLWRG